MARSNSNKRKLIDKVLTSFGLVATLALLSIGGLAWWAYSFTSSNVHDELTAQQIYFPPLGSPALASPKIGPYLNQYAGKQLLTGPEAKAYANHFIAVHLSEVADGKTYSQVSAEAMANPTNVTYKAQQAVLFQGETLRGMLLGDAYAFATIGQIARIAALVCFIAGGVMAVLTLLGYWHLSTLK